MRDTSHAMLMDLRYRNFQVFSQQLVTLWQEEPSLRSLAGNAGDLAKVCSCQQIISTVITAVNYINTRYDFFFLRRSSIYSSSDSVEGNREPDNNV